MTVGHEGNTGESMSTKEGLRGGCFQKKTIKTGNLLKEENGLTVFDVEEGNEDREQPGDSNLTHQLPVAMVGTERQCSFAQVSQTLRSTAAHGLILAPGHQTSAPSS